MRWIDWHGDGSLFVVEVALACCALEVEAAAYARAAEEADPLPDSRVVVVVSGTVTDRLAPAVLAVIDACSRQVRTPVSVVSFGACASSGGPYWDSYAGPDDGDADSDPAKADTHDHNLNAEDAYWAQYSAVQGTSP